MMESNPLWSDRIMVRAYAADFSARWKPTAFFQNMQQAAGAHAAQLGYDFLSMRARDEVWVLSRVKIEWDAFPVTGDEVEIVTWPHGIEQKIFYRREFEFFSGGSRLARATSAWLLISPSARRIVPPQMRSITLPDGGRRALDETLEKILPPADLSLCGTRTAAFSDVDVMGHVNNARYIEWICDIYPLEHYQSRRLSALQINYNKEVLPGETVELLRGTDPADPACDVLVGLKADGERAFEARLTWRKKDD